MLLRKLVFLLVFFHFISFTAHAADYYLSAAGNDNNNGTSPATAWRTIAKLNSVINSFAAGTHIYFNRGDVFTGQITFTANGTLAQRFTFDAYGNGSLPIITGAVGTSGWINIASNVWKCSVTSGTVKQVFENNNRLPIARYPNTGYLRMDNGGSNTSFTDAALTQPDGYFMNSQVVYQSSDYTWEFVTVTNSTSSGLVTHTAAIFDTEAGNGYFFINKQNFADAENEWFYNAGTQELFLYTTANPNGRNIEVSVYEYGIKGEYNREYITIKNIAFEKQSADGVWLLGAPCKYNQISNCTFSNMLLNAITIMGDSIQVSNNIITNAGGIGVAANQINNSVFTGNSCKNIGTYATGGNGGIGDLSALRIWDGNNILIANNTIDSTGYNGIASTTSNTRVEQNIVSHSLLRTADGGGIYAYNSSSNGNVYANNFIRDIDGNIDARPPGHEKIANALYMDNYVQYALIKQNTVSNIDGIGIVINAGAHHNTIRENIVYKCAEALTFPDWLAGNSIYNNIVKKNILYANRLNAVPLVIKSNDNNYNVFTTCDSNYLCNPYSNIVVKYLWSNNSSFTLPQWQSNTGHDIKSIVSFYNWAYPADSSFIIENKTALAVPYVFTNTADLDNQPVTNLVLAPFTSRILIKTPVTVLPVKLISFTGRTMPLHNELSWQAENEINLQGYELEKSNNASVFERIATIPATNTGLLQHYTATDYQPNNNKTYYRLKMINEDGSYSHSNIVFLTTANSHLQISLFPNPANAQLKLVSNLALNTALGFMIIDVSGKIIKQQNLLPVTGNLSISIEVAALPAGKYILQLYGKDGFTLSQVFIKQ